MGSNGSSEHLILRVPELWSITHLPHTMDKFKKPATICNLRDADCIVIFEGESHQCLWSRSTSVSAVGVANAAELACGVTIPCA